MTFSSLNPIDKAIAQAIDTAKAGDNAAARLLLQEVVTTAPENSRAWLWLAHVAQTIEEKRMALRRALLLRPDDTRVQQAFDELMTPQQVRQSAKSGVFINYSRQDDFFAVELADTLRDAGLPVWIDIADIPAEADWHDSIRGALRSCGVMLSVLSQAALQDTQARNEQGIFIKRGKIVIPVLSEACDVQSLNLLYPPVKCYHSRELGIMTLVSLLKPTDHDQRSQ
jgi:hypothetical protein